MQGEPTIVGSSLGVTRLAHDARAPSPLPSRPRASEDARVEPDHMLHELKRLAGRMGIEVRFEPFDPKASRRGGLCTLRGNPLVLVDAHAPTLDKVGVLCEALARFDVEVLYVPPLLRARLQR